MKNIILLTLLNQLRVLVDINLELQEMAGKLSIDIRQDNLKPKLKKS